MKRKFKVDDKVIVIGRDINGMLYTNKVDVLNDSFDGFYEAIEQKHKITITAVDTVDDEYPYRGNWKLNNGLINRAWFMEKELREIEINWRKRFENVK